MCLAFPAALCLTQENLQSWVLWGMKIVVNVLSFHFLVLFGKAACSVSLCLSMKLKEGKRGMLLLSNSSLFGHVVYDYDKKKSLNSVVLSSIQEFYFLFQNQSFSLQNLKLSWLSEIWSTKLIKTYILIKP